MNPHFIKVMKKYSSSLLKEILNFRKKRIFFFSISGNFHSCQNISPFSSHHSDFDF